MKAEKKLSVNLEFDSDEYKMFLKIIEKVLDGEAPLHEISILNKEQLEFLKNLNKLLQ